MVQSFIRRYWKLGLTSFLAIGGALAAFGNYACAQVTPDNTLGSERSVVTHNVIINSLPSDQISGGARRGVNLFHSFQEFSVSEGQRVYFTNPAGVENILSRVTGNNSSNIFGKLGVSEGNANLFLINPNGIIFGPHASLDVKGSFVATTANAIQFNNQGFFNASAPNVPPLLTVNPSALLFNQIGAGSITNNSLTPTGLTRQDPLSSSASSGFKSLFGLQVPDGQSLLLVGGNVTLDGGGVNALGGRVELGGLAGAGTIGLDVNGNNLHLSFPDGAARADISLIHGANVDTSGEGGGNIQVQGRRVTLTDGSQIVSTTLGSKPGGTLAVTASDSLELIGFKSPGTLITHTVNAGKAGDITINAGKLLLQAGAQVSTITDGTGSGGNLTVNVRQSVELIGRSPDNYSSVLSSLALNTGDAGNITVKTRRLMLRDMAAISAESTEKTHMDGNVIQIATGRGGNVTLKGLDSLIVRDRAQINVSSIGTGNAGNLKVKARSILLDNEATLSADTRGGEGNIFLNSQDLVLRRGSNITTDAGGSTIIGGNINIDTDVLVALENSDIRADSTEFRGGKVIINAQSIFGTEFRDTRTLESDITATGGRPELSGTVEITTPDIDPSRGLINLPAVPIETQVVQACTPGGSQQQSEFIITGHGGLPPTPREALGIDIAELDWVTLKPKVDNHTQVAAPTNSTGDTPARLVEAQGWIIGEHGEVILTAHAPTVTPQSSWQTPTDCRGVQERVQELE